MRKQDYIYQLCDYVLGGDFEKNNLKQKFEDNFYMETLPPKKEVRRIMKEIGKEHIWYSASVLLYGKKETNKDLRELINDCL